MNNPRPRLALLLLTLACALGGAADARGQLCGPDSLPPLVTNKKQSAVKGKGVRRRRSNTQVLAAYPFDVGTISFFGFDSRKFDEFGILTWCDVQTRLDNFAVKLQESPADNGYIVAYGDDAARKRLTASFAKKYLTETRGIDGEQLFTADGGFSADFSIVLLYAPTMDYKLSESVEMPAADCRLITGPPGYTACVPSNWRQLSYLGSTFAPLGAFRGPGLFTHGVEFLPSAGGCAQDRSAPRNTRKVVVAGREALATNYFRADEVRGLVLKTTIYNVRIKEGSPDEYTLCVITTAPAYEYEGYGYTFDPILKSLRLPD